MGMPKSDKNTIERRIKSISSMLINGNNREFIVLYCSENWNIGERQADKYISKARTLIEQSVKKQVAYDYAKAVRRYEELYRLSIEKKVTNVVLRRTESSFLTSTNRLPLNFIAFLIASAQRK